MYTSVQRRQDGPEQRLTVAGVADAHMDVKQLVQAYAAWHAETYGMAIAESLKLVVSDSDSGHNSDSSAELSAGLRYNPEIDLQRASDAGASQHPTVWLRA